MVCKTIIRRFESGRRLQLFLGSSISFALLTGACSDPPSPAPVASPSGSTAPWVEWRAADAPVRGPVVVVVDEPGGPMDRLVADPDVTTFLNDRFHPLFRRTFQAEGVAQPTGTLRFYDGCARPLTTALTPDSPDAFIAAANDVIVRDEARACEGRLFPD